jgi:flagellar basal body rod protein FlgG
MTKKIIITGIIIVVLGLIVWTLQIKNLGTNTGDVNTKTYNSSLFGFSFDYPENYFLEEKDLGNSERMHTVLVLTEDSEENRTLREGTASTTAREGPTAITIDVFQNLENETGESWIRGNGNSNFKLSPDGILLTAKVGSRDGYAYRWSGLYEGNSIVFSHKGNIIMSSVTYLGPNDQIVRDFDIIMRSFELKNN